MTTNIDLFWFSGTGNTLFIAKKIKDKLAELGYICSLHPIEKVIELKINNLNTIGIIVPVAMQGTFPLVWEFIKEMPLVEGNEIFLVDTLGVYSGGIKGPLKKIIIRKGYKPIGAIEIIMPNLFLKKVENIKDQIKIDASDNTVRNFCEKLSKNKAHWNDVPLYSRLLASLYNKQEKAKIWNRLFPKSVNNNCINCGICVKLCPKKCIDKHSKHIKEDSYDCILCQRCLEYCPVNAIELKGNIFIKNGLVSLQEMKIALGTDI